MYQNLDINNENDLEQIYKLGVALASPVRVAILSQLMNSYSVVIGTEYNRFFGTELFYQNSDKSNDIIEGEKLKSDFEAYGLDAYAYLPLGCDRVWSVFATTGIANYDIDYAKSGEKEKDNGLGYRLGAGVQYSVTNNIAIRALARKVWADKLDEVDDMKEFSLGIKYVF